MIPGRGCRCCPVASSAARIRVNASSGICAGWWRHRIHRVPFRYEATLWSVVFPLGMYAVAGIYLGRADRLPIVGAIGGAELWVAFAVWALTFVGMVVHVTRTVLLPPAERTGDTEPLVGNGLRG